MRGHGRLRSRSQGVSYDPEPISITADEVAAELERFRRPRMADFVRHLGRKRQDENLREMKLLERINELQAKYEPAQPRTFVNHQPPPEASD